MFGLSEDAESLQEKECLRTRVGDISVKMSRAGIPVELCEFFRTNALDTGGELWSGRREGIILAVEQKLENIRGGAQNSLVFLRDFLAAEKRKDAQGNRRAVIAAIIIAVALSAIVVAIMLG